MKTKRETNLMLVPWLSLPVVLISQIVFWNRMPAEIALHFTTSGRPVTLMSRAGFLLFSLIVLLVVLALGTWKLRRADDTDSSRELVRSYFAVTVMMLIYFGILIYNIYV